MNTENSVQLLLAKLAEIQAQQTLSTTLLVRVLNHLAPNTISKNDLEEMQAKYLRHFGQTAEDDLKTLL